jgi:hypothetical protein
MEKISKNLYKGELITNPMDIKRLVEEKRSVYIEPHLGVCPAAVILHWQFAIIYRMILNNQLYYTYK